jgi:hypothetical protein
MTEHLGGRDLNLADWIERGYEQARQMGVFVPSAKIMERLARAGRRDFRDGFLDRVCIFGVLMLVTENTR